MKSLRTRSRNSFFSSSVQRVTGDGNSRHCSTRTQIASPFISTSRIFGIGVLRIGVEVFEGLIEARHYVCVLGDDFGMDSAFGVKESHLPSAVFDLDDRYLGEHLGPFGL